MAKDLMGEIAAIRERDPRYREEAYIFLLQSLDVTIARIGERRHVTGRELLEGVRILATKRFGPMSRTVFEHWGVKTTADFGHIVFQLVDRSVLSKTETDSIEDFTDVFDFKKAFEEDYAWTAEMDPSERRLKV